MTSRTKTWIGIGVAIYLVLTIYHGCQVKKQEQSTKTIKITDNIAVVGADTGNDKNAPLAHSPAKQKIKVAVKKLTDSESLSLSVAKRDSLISELQAQLLQSGKQTAQLEKSIKQAKVDAQTKLVSSSFKDKQTATLQSSLDDLKQQLTLKEEMLSKKNVALQKANASIARNMSGQIQLGSELKKLTEKERQLESQINEAQAKVSLLESTKEELLKKGSAIKEANKRILSLALINEQSGANLSNAESIIDQLKRNLSEVSLDKDTAEQVAEKQKEELLALRKEKQTFQNEIGNLHARLKDARAKLGIKKVELEKAQLKAEAMFRYGKEKDTQLEPSIQEIVLLKSNLNQKEEVLDTKLSEIKTLTEENKRLTGLTGQYKGTIEEKSTKEKENTKELAEKNRQLYANEKVITILKSAVDNSKKSVAESQLTNDALAQELSTVKELYNGNEAIIAELKKSLEETDKALQDTLTAKNEVLQNKETLENEIASLQETFSAKTQEVEAMSLERDNAVTELVTTQTALQDAENNATVLQQVDVDKSTQLSALQQTIEELQATLAEKSVLIDDLTANIASIKVEHSKLEAESENKQAFTDELTALKSLLQTKEQSLAETQDALQAANQKADQILSQEEEKGKESEELQQKISEMEPHLTDLKQQKEAALLKLQETEANLVLMSQESENLVEEKRMLASKLDEASTLIASLQSANTVAIPAVDHEQIDTLQKKAMQLEDENKNIQEQLNQAHEKVQELNVALESAKNAPVTEKVDPDEIQALKEIIEAREINLEELTVKLSQTVEQNEQASLQLKELKDTKQQLLEDKDSLQKDMESLTGKLSILQEDNNSGQNNLDKITAELETLRQTLDTSNKQLDEKESTITTLIEKIKLLESEHASLRLQTIDSDNDSVPDADDKCPSSTPGTDVDEQGCEKDTDGDGLVDSLDLCPGTAKGAHIDERGCSEKEEIILSGVTFELGTADLTNKAKANLDKVAVALQKTQGTTFEVAGFTDSIGDKKRNQQISTRRAKVVRQYLIEKGVNKDLLIPKGYGPAQPRGDNNTQVGRAANRRVELRKLDGELDSVQNTEAKIDTAPVPVPVSAPVVEEKFSQPAEQTN